MAAIVMKSTSPVGAMLDVTEGASRTLARKDEQTRARIMADLRAMQQVYDEADAGADTARTNRELTSLGRAKAASRAIAAARAALAPHAERVAKMEAADAAARATAMQTPPGERTPDALALEREIRDRVVAAKEDPLLVAVRYRQAISEGDWQFVRAVEAAPKQFALIRPDAREQGDLMKLVRSPNSDALQDSVEVTSLYRSTLKTTEAELARLAEQHGVRLPDDTSEV